MTQVVLTVFVSAMLNHLRFYWMLPYWAQKTAKQPRSWLWLKVQLGILFPMTVIIDLPSLVKVLEGGSPSWAEPFGLMPDLTVWLLMGMGLNLVRSLIHAAALARIRSEMEFFPICSSSGRNLLKAKAQVLTSLGAQNPLVLADFVLIFHFSKMKCLRWFVWLKFIPC